MLDVADAGVALGVMVESDRDIAGRRDEQVLIELNTDFGAKSLSAGEIHSIVAACQGAGAW